MDNTEIVEKTVADYVECDTESGAALIPAGGNGIVWGWLAGQLSQTSIDQYRRFWHAYANFAGSGDVLDDQMLRRWRDHMVLNTDLGVRTINTRLAGVARVIDEAARRGHIDQAIADRCLRVERVSVRALRDRQNVHVRAALSGQDVRRLCEHPDPATLPGLRDRALLFFLASSAVRVGEAVALTIDSMQARGSGWSAHVLGKTDTEPRLILFSPEAKDWIDRWLVAREIDTPYVFTGFAGRSQRPLSTPLSIRAAETIVSDHASALSLVGVTPHTLRAFVATELARTDLGIAGKVLGHRNERTTLSYVRRGLTGGETNSLF